MTVMRPRVVITGLGIVGPLGLSAPAFWSALIAGGTGARHRDFDGIDGVTVFPAEGADEAARALIGTRDYRRMDRVGHLATLAAAEALTDAGPHGAPPERVGASLGCVHGGAATLESASEARWRSGADRVGPLTIPLGLTNGAVAAVARTFEVHGPTSVAGTACAAGTDAVGTAAEWIRSGRADVVLAGGAEAPLVTLLVAGYRKLGALSRSTRPPDEASRPFDSARDGFVMGEAGAVLILEARDRAVARGARIYAEVLGHAATCDAGHLTDPDPAGSGAARAITLALTDAGIAPGRVEYINAHATATQAGDLAESRAIVAAGLAHAPISATKGAHGHPLGAAGALEAAITALAIDRQVLPATRNLVDPDPGAPLDHITTPRHGAVHVAVSNSFGFGGHNACLVLGADSAALPGI
jgi:3-oxoacyl-[acyl-carrier-protein] synthase II